MSETIKVTLAYPYTDAEGKAHKADATVTLPHEVGKNLIHAGRARRPDDKPVAKSATPPPRKRAAKKTTAKKAATPEANTAEVKE